MELINSYYKLIDKPISENIEVINSIEKKLNLDSISKENKMINRNYISETSIKINSTQIESFLEACNETHPLTRTNINYQLNCLIKKIKIIVKNIFRLL